MTSDDARFRVLVEREYRPLVRGLALYCGDRFVAEELVQDAFARTYQRWERVGGLGRPGAWLHTVAFNLARSRFRRRAAERRAYARHGPTEDAAATTDTADALTVRAAVRELPPRQREIVIHRYFLGRSVAETAEVVGISDGAVKAATFKAKASLREALGLPDGAQEGHHRG